MVNAVMKNENSCRFSSPNSEHSEKDTVAHNMRLRISLIRRRRWVGVFRVGRDWSVRFRRNCEGKYEFSE